MMQAVHPQFERVGTAVRRVRKAIRILLAQPTRLAFSLCGLLVFPAVTIAADPATVSFTLDFPTSEPTHYSISVNSEGHAKYECSARTSPDSDERESYQTEFDVTPANRTRIFDLAAQAHYFSGKVDSGNSKLAFTGSKKLVYQDGHGAHSTEFNYSNLPAVQQLTEFFQGLASTMEYGRRIAYYHRYQKLALDEELKRMESQAKNNELIELQAVQPVLKQIYEDASVMNVVRARAQRLIEMGGSKAGASR